MMFIFVKKKYIYIKRSGPRTGDIVMTGDGGQWLDSQNSNPKTLGSIPWRGRVRNSVFPVHPALTAAVALPWSGGPNRDNKVY